MDLSFGRKRKRRTTAPVRLDYPRLTAILASAQANSATARIDGRLAQDSSGRVTPVEGLVALLESGSGWIEAARALEGSFHPGVAGRAP